MTRSLWSMELKELKNCVTTNLNFEVLYILIFRILKFFLSKKIVKLK